MSDDRSKEYREKSTVDTSEKWERDYWTDKWGISDQQLSEAIKETGSRDVETLEKYLINKRIT